MREQSQKGLLHDILGGVRIVKHRQRETVESRSLAVEEIRHMLARAQELDRGRPGGSGNRVHELECAHTYTTRRVGRL